jgi:hypothetical protein
MAKKAGVPPTGKKGKPKHDDPEQSERFKQTARELGVDESGQDFEEAIKQILPSRIDR